MLIALQGLPAEWQRVLWYDREAVAAGEYWRILTGNLVHLGWMHLAHCSSAPGCFIPPAIRLRGP